MLHLGMKTTADHFRNKLFDNTVAPHRLLLGKYIFYQHRKRMLKAGSLRSDAINSTLSDAVRYFAHCINGSSAPIPSFNYLMPKISDQFNRAFIPPLGILITGLATVNHETY